MSKIAVDLKNKRITCFAYSDKGCRATTNKDCKECPFYKTKKQLQNEQIKSEERIRKIYGISYKEHLEMKGLY